MRVLVLGAGALGGYFGGRLAEAGGDVTFLVRPGRAAALAKDGLAIESQFGNAKLAVKTIQAAKLQPGWDVILLSNKAYDLDDAISTIRPGVDGRTAILPVLNGLSHIDTLKRAFGVERVLGGLCKIQATLTPAGVVKQLNDWRWLTFGELDGAMSPRVQALEAAYAKAIGVEAKAVPNINQRLWEKLVHLGTSAVGTVLMRANVGEIVRAGGSPLLISLLERNAAIAAHHGHPMPEAFMAEYRALFSDGTSAYATSMLRDVEAGNRIEGEHILGFLAEAAKRAGVETAIHEMAALQARAYEQRRAAGRLPHG
ncbi:ketopantoate reductase family protein [Roseococcus pinisoli]|uniref:2-dehydropantoate 2-reductase n=1 Tax=Roseococcus pinisoli TaxID=2835040 RepID=A0ABS5QA54_9PROT|nr:ketopantoate reductase family protein [Roseococcus pinisoli]MBS7809478.1 ketopantoate reductase family protein [Roseococcus pinisoli]